MKDLHNLVISRHKDAVKEYNKGYSFCDAQTVGRMRTIWVSDILRVQQIILTRNEYNIKNPMIDLHQDVFFWKLGYGRKNKPINAPSGTFDILLAINNTEERENLTFSLTRQMAFIHVGEYDDAIAEKLRNYNRVQSPTKAKGPAVRVPFEVLPSIELLLAHTDDIVRNRPNKYS